MHFLRRSVYHFVSVLLFTFLVLTAWTTTATLTFGKPDRLESWLTQSKLYDHFVDEAIAKSNKNGKGNNDSGKLPLSDPGVQQAAKAAFPPATIQSAVNTFLNANYAWLEGKTATPEFSVDLSQEKATLATNLGSYAQTRAAALPKCTSLSQVSGEFDALSATCLPPGLTPAAVGQLEQQKVATGDFLSNPVITAQNLNENQSKDTSQQASQPKQAYYVKLSQLPRAYRAATKLPWLVAVLAVLSGVGVVFLAAARRKGARRIGTLLVAAGLVILLLILASNLALHRVENKALTGDKVGQLQQSLVDFAHRAQSFLARVDLWFGVGFVIAGIAIWLLLKFVWPTTKMPKANVSQPDGPDSPKPTRPSKKITPIQL